MADLWKKQRNGTICIRILISLLRSQVGEVQVASLSLSAMPHGPSIKRPGKDLRCCCGMSCQDSLINIECEPLAAPRLRKEAQALDSIQAISPC